MVWSMTGYGREVCTKDRTGITVEIRSVNHRFLDISPKLPQTILFLEEEIKKVVKDYFSRGRVEVHIHLDDDALIKRNLTVDWELMDQYIDHLREIKAKYHLSGDIPLELAASHSDLFRIVENEKEQGGLSEAIIETVERACRLVYKMRDNEGSQLAEDMLSRIENIKKLAKWLGERRDIVIMEYRDRIINRIQDYLDEEVKDNARITQEAALIAEKGDITEEVTRLLSHVDQFRQTILQQEAVGRKLDFILQEMLRETNTIGSKSNDVQISERIVDLKSEIEKVKEQTQNIE
ncbi:YicC/YloC family endoribonuclease [Sediminibacillus halophilus]|uniref:TIGR00255 family protein n=1 Tax=Sediminibacillus halophilus TaxID=482461 RepID=A0A1G9MNX4_9BACI|nr:YicC/YloC family endoribonuclease [Sediminibacillus halophilus]SDL75731.1 TIGR00255 family protein [Sediminibacillus halophilus]